MTIILAASAFEARAGLTGATGAPNDQVVVIRVARAQLGLDLQPRPEDRNKSWRAELFDDDDLVTWEDAAWR